MNTADRTPAPGLGTAVRLAFRDLRGGIKGFRVMIACLALEEKIHAKKSVIVGIFPFFGPVTSAGQSPPSGSCQYQSNQYKA